MGDVKPVERWTAQFCFDGEYDTPDGKLTVTNEWRESVAQAFGIGLIGRPVCPVKWEGQVIGFASGLFNTGTCLHAHLRIHQPFDITCRVTPVFEVDWVDGLGHRHPWHLHELVLAYHPAEHGLYPPHPGWLTPDECAAADEIRDYLAAPP